MAKRLIVSDSRLFSYQPPDGTLTYKTKPDGSNMLLDSLVPNGNRYDTRQYNPWGDTYTNPYKPDAFNGSHSPAVMNNRLSGRYHSYAPQAYDTTNTFDPVITGGSQSFAIMGMLAYIGPHDYNSVPTYPILQQNFYYRGSGATVRNMKFSAQINAVMEIQATEPPYDTDILPVILQYTSVVSDVKRRALVCRWIHIDPTIPVTTLRDRLEMRSGGDWWGVPPFEPRYPTHDTQVGDTYYFWSYFDQVDFADSAWWDTWITFSIKYDPSVNNCYFSVKRWKDGTLFNGWGAQPQGTSTSFPLTDIGEYSGGVEPSTDGYAQIGTISEDPNSTFNLQAEWSQYWLQTESCFWDSPGDPDDAFLGYNNYIDLKYFTYTQGAKRFILGSLYPTFIVTQDIPSGPLGTFYTTAPQSSVYGDFAVGSDYQLYFKGTGWVTATLAAKGSSQFTWNGNGAIVQDSLPVGRVIYDSRKNLFDSSTLLMSDA